MLLETTKCLHRERSTNWSTSGIARIYEIHIPSQAKLRLAPIDVVRENQEGKFRPFPPKALHSGKIVLRRANVMDLVSLGFAHVISPAHVDRDCSLP